MKFTYAAIVALALPVGLVAQQPSGAPQANPVTGVFRTRTMGLHRNLAQAFDSIPEAKFSYKPTPMLTYAGGTMSSNRSVFRNPARDISSMGPSTAPPATPQ